MMAYVSLAAAGLYIYGLLFQLIHWLRPPF
jgi:hypothetical protein